MKAVRIPAADRVRGALAWAIVPALALIPLVDPPAAPAALPSVPLADCATPADIGDLEPGDQAIGFTVRRGSTPEQFDAEILGVLPNGVAPGRDLVVIEASGDAIDDGGGISAGMSGSPLYTLDGELIGSVSYGFSYSPSPIGGVTPAGPDMLPLLDEASTLAATPRQVRLSSNQRQAIAGRAAARVPSGSMSQLRTPFMISGSLLPKHQARLQKKFDERDLPYILTGGGSASAQSLDPTGDLDPADAFFAGISFGDITSGGLGTATYVCDGQALAFGHPFSFSGPAAYGATEANIVSIVEDSVYGAFKLGYPTDPVGMVDLDRLGGIRAQLGVPIPTVPITQDTTALDTGRERLGSRTDAVASGKGFEAGTLPFLAFLHMLYNFDSVFDQIGAGSADLEFHLSGVDPQGDPWTLNRSDRFTSRWDIAWDASWPIESYLSRIGRFADEGAAVETVDIDADVERDHSSLAIGDVLWRFGGGKLRKAHRTEHLPVGSSMIANIPLKPTDGGKTKWAKMKFRVPASERPVYVSIESGGGQFGNDWLLCFLFGECPNKSKLTFKQLLRQIRSAPHNSDLVGRLGNRKGSTTRTKGFERVISGGEFFVVDPIKGGKNLPEDGAALEPVQQ